MQRADRWITAARTVEAQHDNPVVEHRHVDAAGLAPETEQRRLAGGHQPRRLLPVSGIDERHPSNAATCWNQATSGPGSQTPAISTSARWANIGT